ncbi:MAG TPA: hypothetical protein P5243_09305 [Bacteroidales bacterium]|jgi:hypothetical protein|nr:hypothetical protein [Bacteroidales bacterium]
MIYKFRVISDENETFLRIIEISKNDTFLKLHDAIIAACDYDPAQMTSFFVSNKDWEKLQEITLFDMKDESTKTIPMHKAVLKDYVSKVDDTLIYIFDFFADRALFLTLVEIKKEDPKMHYPVCSYETGNPPIQMLQDENEFTQMFNDLEDGEDFEDFDDLDDDIKGEFDEYNEFDDFGGVNDYDSEY